MSLSSPFNKFHPFNGDASITNDIYLEKIANRMRRLLSNRSAEQIDSAATTITWAITDYYDALENIERKFKIPFSEHTSMIEGLKLSVDAWDNIGGEGFPNGKKYEFFAVLAAWLLANAVIWHSSKESSQTKLATDATIEAMEAITYAEHLYEVDEIHLRYEQKRHVEEQVKIQKRAIKSAELNILRHKKTNEAKAAVLEEWNKTRYDYKSAEKAGLFFYNWLLNRGIEYEPRTITRWIRDYAKKAGIEWSK